MKYRGNQVGLGYAEAFEIFKNYQKMKNKPKLISEISCNHNNSLGKPKN